MLIRGEPVLLIECCLDAWSPACNCLMHIYGIVNKYPGSIALPI